MIGWPYQIRFSAEYLNYLIFGLLCLLLPVSLFVRSLFVSNKELRIAGVVFSVMVAVPAFLFALFAFMDVSDVAKQGDTSQQIIGNAVTEQGVFRLYLMNCGATCSYGLLLKKEIDTPIGVKFVKPIWSIDKESEARITATNNAIRITKGNVTLYEYAL
jgi:hypothetical protein